MNSTNNSIFFNALAQFARDSSTGPAFSAAVANVLTHSTDFFLTRPSRRKTRRPTFAGSQHNPLKSERNHRVYIYQLAKAMLRAKDKFTI